MSAVETHVAPHAPAGPVLRTLVIADLVESAALTEMLGDPRAIELFRKRDRLGRELLARHGGIEIDKTDGFLAMFDRPIRAIAFALDYQRALRTLGRGEGVPMSARVGLHVGDVIVMENSAQDIAAGAKPVEVEGLVKPIAARLMSLARPGQILMSGVAHTLAQRGREELGERAATVRFKHYGRYRFKGVADPLPVYEVGEPEIAPLKRPPNSDKGRRERPWWFRPRALAAEFVALFAAVATIAWFATHPEPAIAFAARDWVVVGDLHNLTGEKGFDAALDAAMRVSLEQSRFVNLVSDLQVRDALKRMTKPTGTPVDRAIGSEIALREGARALIIPTVAEVGGRIRVSAEVVDPHTQATVYAQSADGDGAESALGSVDKVARELRGKLGEALKSIESDSTPLPKVTTGNLEALRAFALGWRANIEGRYADALPLYEQAVKLDPGFALAYMGGARVRFAADDRAAAFAYLQQALAHRDRLPQREQLYLDAWLANFGSPREAIAKWKLVAAVYPDYYWAHSNYALFSEQYANRYEDALEAARAATSVHNPFRRSAYYLVAALELALEQREKALADFQTARELGVGGSLLAYADAYLAARDYPQAQRVMAQAQPTGLPTSDIYERRFDVALAVDQGRWDEALGVAQRSAEDAARIAPLAGRAFAEAALSLRAFGPPDRDVGGALELALDAERAQLDDDRSVERNHAAFATAALGYLALRAGHGAIAERAIAAAAKTVPALGFPNADAMLAIAQAERARVGGRPEQALALLAPVIDGNELCVAHVVRREALADLGRNEEALAEARWNATHRGRAFVENGSNSILRALNIAESSLALLRAAELERALGRRDEAKRDLDAFLAAWPEAERVGFVAARVRALRAL